MNQPFFIIQNLHSFVFHHHKLVMNPTGSYTIPQIASQSKSLTAWVNLFRLRHLGSSVPRLICDRKSFGHIPGIPVGMGFVDRKELADACVHGRPAWGIHGTETEGVYAIVLNGGYEDDDDRGETM